VGGKEERVADWWHGGLGGKRGRNGRVREVNGKSEGLGEWVAVRRWVGGEAGEPGKEGDAVP
jgi:hypothetical protein